jgi:hypothetical protein
MRECRRVVVQLSGTFGRNVLASESNCEEVSWHPTSPVIAVGLNRIQRPIVGWLLTAGGERIPAKPQSLSPARLGQGLSFPAGLNPRGWPS